MPHLPTYSVHWPILPVPSIASSHLSIHLFVLSFIHSFVRLSVRPSVRSFIVAILCSFIQICLILCLCDCNVSQHQNNIHETLHLHVTYCAISKLVRRYNVSCCTSLQSALLYKEFVLCIVYYIGKSSLSLFEKIFRQVHENCNCLTCLFLRDDNCSYIDESLTLLFQFYTVS